MISVCPPLQGQVNYTEDMSGSDDEDHDAYMERMKAEGKEKDEDFQLDDEDDESEGLLCSSRTLCSGFVWLLTECFFGGSRMDFTPRGCHLAVYHFPFVVVPPKFDAFFNLKSRFR